MKHRLHSSWSRYRRSGRSARSRRAAFSLAELVVAIGILLLMLALAGQVMSLTVRSTGQATALTQINQRLRVLEESLREDLRKIDRERSVMVIQGNPVNAYWTQVGKESDIDDDPSNGYPNALGPVYERTLAAGTGSAPAIVVPEPPRADILMFFTTRKGRSFVDYKYQDPDLRGTPVTANLQQVVYGHAELGEWGDDGSGNWLFNPNVSSTIDPDPSFPDWAATDPRVPPASQWHLARRSVLLVDVAPPLGVGVGGTWVDATTIQREDWERIRQGEADVLGLFDFDSQLILPSANFGDWPFYWPRMFNNKDAVPYIRSQLDPTPPPAIADRMGHYLLPNCASFKVEWALDPDSDVAGGLLDLEREVHWIDPGKLKDDMVDTDPLAPLDAAQVAAEDAAASSGSSYEDKRAQNLGTLLAALSGRFRRQNNPDWILPPEYGPGQQTHSFTVTRAGDPEEIFPVALRITVDLWDTEGRLDRPVRHVMVLPVGE